MVGGSVLEGDDGVDPVDVVGAVPEHAGEVVGVRGVVELDLAAEAPVLGEGVDLSPVVHHLVSERRGEGRTKSISNTHSSRLDSRCQGLLEAL